MSWHDWFVQWSSFIGVCLDAVGAALLLGEWAIGFRESVDTEAAKRRLAGKTFWSDEKPLVDLKVVRGRVLREAMPRVSLYVFGLLFLAAGFLFQAFGSWPR
jgi:hypothetical protein